MKVCSIVGRLTKDCRIQENAKGGFVAFSVAVDDGYGANKSTIFFDIDYNRTRIAKYLTKGTQVAVSGDLKTREYNGRTYLGIRANEVKLIGVNKNKPEYQDGGTSSHTEHDKPATSDMDDEIPW